MTIESLRLSLVDGGLPPGVVRVGQLLPHGGSVVDLLNKKIHSSGSIRAGAVQAQYTVEVERSGKYHVTATLHDTSKIYGDYYTLTILLNYHPNNEAHVFQYEDKLAALIGSSDGSVDDASYSAWIQHNWWNVVAGGTTTTLHVAPSAGELASEIIFNFGLAVGYVLTKVNGRAMGTEPNESP